LGTSSACLAVHGVVVNHRLVGHLSQFSDGLRHSRNALRLLGRRRGDVLDHIIDLLRPRAY
jgi:hypothetical protein